MGKLSRIEADPEALAVGPAPPDAKPIPARPPAPGPRLGIEGRSYQLRRIIRFMSGSPANDAVVWSPVILPNNWGLRKSTWLVGLLKPQLWNGFWKSKRSCTFARSLIGKFFWADAWE